MIEKNQFKTLTMILTTDCNLNCTYCFCGKKHKKEMNLLSAKKYIDFFRRYSVDDANICFFGGEPLLKGDLIEELCKYICEVYDEKANLSITTNGTLINRKYIEMMKKYNIQMQVSIDGYEESHDKSRKFYNGNGSWKYIMDNITNYCEELPMIRMTYTPNEIEKLSKNIKKLVQLGFKKIAFMPTSDIEWKGDKLKIYKNQYDEICNFYYKCFAEGTDVYFMEFDNIIRSHIYDMKTRGSCKPGVAQISIDPDGKIFPCNRVNFNGDELCLGNILTGFDERYNNYIKNINKSDKMCLQCALFDRCLDCKIENYEDTNSFEINNECKCFMNQEKIYAVDKIAAKLYSEGNKDFIKRFYQYA